MKKEICRGKQSRVAWWKRAAGSVSEWSTSSWRATVSALGSAVQVSSGACNRALIATTGSVAAWHEDLKLEQEHPELAEHLDIRDVAEKQAEKLSRIGWGHRRSTELMIAGGVALFALQGSMPTSIPPAQKKKTEQVACALAAEINRLGEGRPSPDRFFLQPAQ